MLGRVNNGPYRSIIRVNKKNTYCWWKRIYCLFKGHDVVITKIHTIVVFEWYCRRCGFAPKHLSKLL
jgi:hypothetical protein